MGPANEYWLCLTDANGRERDSSRPFLVFDRTNGVFEIADDYETSNDPTTRDFVLDKDDVMKLIAALTDYALHGTTSTAECSSQHDIEERIK